VSSNLTPSAKPCFCTRQCASPGPAFEKRLSGPKEHISTSEPLFERYRSPGDGGRTPARAQWMSSLTAMVSPRFRS